MKNFIKDMILHAPFFSGLTRRYHFASNVHKELGEEDILSVLELGCGVHSYLSTLKTRPYSIGVDIYEPSARKAQEKGVYDEVHIMDARDIASRFPEKSFDCVMAMDFIEHLNKTDGLKLLSMIEKIARKKIILYTPNGFLEQGEEYGNPWQRHLSGWSAEEMISRSFRVTGWGGLKAIRPQFLITRKPVFFWRFVQWLTNLYVHTHPKRAFQILCVKDLG
jgi:hypothetical protein